MAPTLRIAAGHAEITAPRDGDGPSSQKPKNPSEKAAAEGNEAEEECLGLGESREESVDWGGGGEDSIDWDHALEKAGAATHAMFC